MIKTAGLSNTDWLQKGVGFERYKMRTLCAFASYLFSRHIVQSLFKYIYLSTVSETFIKASISIKWLPLYVIKFIHLYMIFVLGVLCGREDSSSGQYRNKLCCIFSSLCIYGTVVVSVYHNTTGFCYLL